MKTSSVSLFLCIICLVCCTFSPAHAQTADTLEAVLTRQDEIEAQYDELALELLYPAGDGKQFESFRMRNPAYLVSSYSRSRTAVYIRGLLNHSPGALKVFAQCGLSRGGEYFCRNINCPVHGDRIRGSKPGVILSRFDFRDGARFMTAAVSGIVLFVFVTGIGSLIVGRMENRRNHKNNAAEKNLRNPPESPDSGC